jgi:Pao retrotransposon peptidase
MSSWIENFKMVADSMIKFVGFCDASVDAYAAVIYCRIKKMGNFEVYL